MARVAVQDHAATGRAPDVEVLLQGLVERFRAAVQAPRRPLRAVLSRLAVPGFTETQVEVHVLHLQGRAAGEPWFPGLLAREVAHAALSDLGHPSHDPALLHHSFEAAKRRSKDLGFLGLVGSLNHHVRDVYADDLAAKVEPAALEGFLEHLAALAAEPRSPTEAAVEAGYAAGTLMRRGRPAPPALRALLEGSPEAGRLADAFAGLHPDPGEADLLRAVERLVALVPP